MGAGVAVALAAGLGLALGQEAARPRPREPAPARYGDPFALTVGEGSVWAQILRAPALSSGASSRAAR